MAKARVAMYVIEDVLRLHHECGRSQREIARSCGLSPETVNKLLRLAGQAGVARPLPAELDEAQLEERLYGRPAGSRRSRQLEGIDFAVVHKELKARKHLTLRRVWQEYCEQYRQWKSRQNLVMLQEHKAGENLFVDYGGQTVPIDDAASGATRRSLWRCSARVRTFRRRRVGARTSSRG